MVRKLFTGRRIKMLLILLVLAFIGLNVIAYVHARAMTRFVMTGDRTQPPEKLSLVQKSWVLLTGVKLPRPVNQKTPGDFGLPYETLKFRGAFDIPLEAWLIQQTNSKGLIVMFHGYGGSKDGLLPSAKIFHELGYDTLLVDFFGSGGSAGQTTSVGFHEAVDVHQAFAQARELARGRPIILFGTSMGAAAILKAIHDGGVEPAAIIVECPFDTMLATVKHRFEAMKVPSFPSAQLLVFWGGQQNGFNGFQHNPVHYAHGVTCPALLLHGDRDARVSVPEAQSVYDQFSGRKQFVLLPGVGHECYALAKPDEWKRSVVEFLQSVK